MSALKIHGVSADGFMDLQEPNQLALEEGRFVMTNTDFVVFGSAKAGATVSVEYKKGSHHKTETVTADLNRTWRAKFSRAQGERGNDSMLIAKIDSEETASFVVTIVTHGGP